jgi:hypothetical protein
MSDMIIDKQFLILIYLLTVRKEADNSDLIIRLKDLPILENILHVYGDVLKSTHNIRGTVLEEKYNK